MSGKSPTPRGRKKRATPESFRGRMMSVSLTASDLARSLAWYRDVLRFTIDREIEREGKVIAVALKAGSIRVLLNQDDGAKGLNRSKGEGLSLQITTAQDIDALASGIKERGGTLLMEPTDMPWGARIFRLRDPDGFSLVISTERRP